MRPSQQLCTWTTNVHAAAPRLQPSPRFVPHHTPHPSQAMSTMATCSFEEVAASAPNTCLLFQLYVIKDRAIVEGWVRQAEACGYKVKCTGSALQRMRGCGAQKGILGVRQGQGTSHPHHGAHDKGASTNTPCCTLPAYCGAAPLLVLVRIRAHWRVIPLHVLC